MVTSNDHKIFKLKKTKMHAFTFQFYCCFYGRMADDAVFWCDRLGSVLNSQVRRPHHLAIFHTLCTVANI